jgi:transcriptional regulator with XRE-family HTH domain
MEKSIFTPEYLQFLGQLRMARKTAGMTQEQVAARLRQTQSFVSKCERGERRIDVIELRAYCRAIGISLIDFIEQLESIIESREN